MFVSLFVHHFLPNCLRIQDTFKSSLYSKQVDKVKKVACRWSTINRYSLEARKMLVLTLDQYSTKDQDLIYWISCPQTSFLENGGYVLLRGWIIEGQQVINISYCVLYERAIL